MTPLPEPPPTDRAALLERLAARREPWDMLIIGGGATGLALALDAATRGLAVLLVEAHDFAKGTSSRATKLLHGGVRYLAQGHLPLVREALRERSTLLAMAPGLSRRLAFVMPSYRLGRSPFYGAGLVLYDLLAGGQRIERTRYLSRADLLARLPSLKPEGLRDGVEYWDGQFDDAGLALALARGAAAQGALVINHCAVTAPRHTFGRIIGAELRDAESGQTLNVSARCVVNATGVWVDALRQQDAELRGESCRAIVAPSQGLHLVVSRDFWPYEQALLVPDTGDGRVMFAVPWLGKVVLGTTDTPRADLPLEPEANRADVDAILSETARYLRRPPTRADVLSHWSGIRPLVRGGADGGATSGISREHTIEVSPSGLVTVTGGKWTTCRAMAEDILSSCERHGLTGPLPPCRTASLRLPEAPVHDAAAAPDAQAVHRYVHREWARSVEDVLARRSRLLFLDAAAAERAAPAVAEALARETGREPGLDDFVRLARQYQQLP